MRQSIEHRKVGEGDSNQLYQAPKTSPTEQDDGLQEENTQQEQQ